MEQSRGPVAIAHPLGMMEVPADAVMRFTVPMWGFEPHREFALLPAARRGLWWFLSTTDSATTFVLADPFVAVDGYSIDLTDHERDELALVNEADALALVLVALPGAAGGSVTANFRAPLVFNLSKCLVKQVVNRDEQFGLAEAVDLSRYPLQDEPVAEG